MMRSYSSAQLSRWNKTYRKLQEEVWEKTNWWMPVKFKQWTPARWAGYMRTIRQDEAERIAELPGPHEPPPLSMEDKLMATRMCLLYMTGADTFAAAKHSDSPIYQPAPSWLRAHYDRRDRELNRTIRKMRKKARDKAAQGSALRPPAPIRTTSTARGSQTQARPPARPPARLQARAAIGPRTPLPDFTRRIEEVDEESEEDRDIGDFRDDQADVGGGDDCRGRPAGDAAAITTTVAPGDCAAAPGARATVVPFTAVEEPATTATAAMTATMQAKERAAALKIRNRRKKAKQKAKKQQNGQQQTVPVRDLLRQRKGTSKQARQRYNRRMKMTLGNNKELCIKIILLARKHEKLADFARSLVQKLGAQE
ncbi:hypothetical protein OC835_007640 [Tilletia horrida]|nr:hypothetical protein OC835_007640 [Tilletia horrida]